MLKQPVAELLRSVERMFPPQGYDAISNLRLDLVGMMESSVRAIGEPIFVPFFEAP